MVKFVKNRLGNYVSQLSFYESLSLAILNSQEFQKREILEQKKVREYLEDDSFRKYIDIFEKSIENLSISSSDFEWK